MIKVSINNLRYPIITAKEFTKYSDDFLMTEYFVRPKFASLPDLDSLDEEEKEAYKFKDIPEDVYLVGLEVISETWVNRGFCGRILEAFGLVVDEAFPVSQTESTYSTKTLIRINFGHVYRGYSNKENLRVEKIEAPDEYE
jgi:hypothetical protein